MANTLFFFDTGATADVYIATTYKDTLIYEY